MSLIELVCHECGGKIAVGTEIPEELRECFTRCDVCDVPEECETCGKGGDECRGECCQCTNCMARRALKGDRPVDVIINGRGHRVNGVVTSEWIAYLAFGETLSVAQARQCTVTWKLGGMSGSLAFGDAVTPLPGMIFNAAFTGAA